MYIFFDVDGVLNSFITLSEGRLSDRYIRNLIGLVKLYNGKLVLISTRRYGFDRGFFGRLKPISPQCKLLVDKLKKHNVKIYDLLPESPNENRAEEIKEYINEKRIKEFIIIDDEPFNYKKLDLKENLVNTHFSNANDRADEGFSEKRFRNAKAIISKIYHI